MARLSLNKSSLSHEQSQLRTFEQFLPSLDLKRRQLIAERAKATREVVEREAAIARLREEIGRELPMAANRDVDLDGLATVTNVVIGEQNIVGVRLPLMSSVAFQTRPYSFLSKPHWVDRAVACLCDLMEQELRLKIAGRRLAILEKAVTTITQRVNLFDRVLIPRARANIKRIQIHLSDAEREAVVRAKNAKSKTAPRAAHARVAEL
jgi:V/A-type H+-transporting ATPase subunit D